MHSNYIIFKDKHSDMIKGLLISELPPITKPKMRYKTTYIDGVDGCYIEEQGYESYTKEIQIGLHGNYNIDEVIEYFSGSGTITFSNEDDKYYNVSILEKIDYERLVRFKKAKIKMFVQPYKYQINTSPLELTNGKIIENIGNTESKPTLYLKGSGVVKILVDDMPLFTYDFTNGNEVYIDGEKQDAYFNENLLNRNMNGEFITFKKGKHKISWNGNLQTITIDKFSRWL